MDSKKTTLISMVAIGVIAGGVSLASYLTKGHYDDARVTDKERIVNTKEVIEYDSKGNKTGSHTETSYSYRVQIITKDGKSVWLNSSYNDYNSLGANQVYDFDVYGWDTFLSRQTIEKWDE